MALNWTDDPTLLGYWFDKTNGMQRVKGFFEILNDLNEDGDYTSTDGNPITMWESSYMAGDETRYKGIPNEELDQLFLDHSFYKTIRGRYREQFTKAQSQFYTKIPPVVERITRMYSHKWKGLWESMFYDYNPIENYNMTENMTNDVTELEHGHQDELTNDLSHSKTGTETAVKTGTETDAKTGTETATKTGTETLTPADTKTETDQIEGFNSATFVDANKKTTVMSGTDTTTYDTEDEITYNTSDETTYNTEDELTYNTTDTDTGTATHVHSGTDTTTRN